LNLLKAEKVIGWFQGRMEFGPRALGNRSILAMRVRQKMQSVMKFEGEIRANRSGLSRHRPARVRGGLFETGCRVALHAAGRASQKELCARSRRKSRALTGSRKPVPRCRPSRMLDYSARIQTVEREGNPLLYDLLLRFEQGHPLRCAW